MKDFMVLLLLAVVICAAPIDFEKASNEQTLIVVKPDGVRRGLTGRIIQRFEDRGYKIVAIKMLSATLGQLELNYWDHKGLPYYEEMLAYMQSGPVVAMVWQGFDVANQARIMLVGHPSEKNPSPVSPNWSNHTVTSPPGSIRGDFAIHNRQNVCHGSDSAEAAKKEIALWFRADEIQPLHIDPNAY
ncbi:unnamed protein product, partial [Mesorhabditis belari]|uniref:nucleoside-diphosphate kinase n=1 Tax=Mesorhabditis belari TaxID=2138241 RepID=A0AAF3EM95_9BILA